MSGSILNVTPGVPTQLSGATPDNYTIYNQDSVNSVWIGNSNAVAPNLGMKLGPLGTMNWQKSSGLAFACVDTGVNKPISLNVSNDVTNVVNPVDVATATAIQILARGVPDVLLTQTLLDNVVVTGGNNVVVDVSGQASLVLTVTDTVGNPSNVVVELFFMKDSTLTDIAPVTLMLSAPAAGGTAAGQWKLPVYKGTLQIANLAGNDPVRISLTGSNRPTDKIIQPYLSLMPRKLQFFGNFVANTAVQCVQIDSIQTNVTYFNGPVKIAVEGGSAAFTANFLVQCQYAGPSSVGSGALLAANVTAQLAAAGTFDFVHPPIPLAWFVLPKAAATNAQAVLTIVPSASSGV